MEIKRCATCNYWTGQEDKVYMGECLRMSAQQGGDRIALKIGTAIDLPVYTSQSFGCIFHSDNKEMENQRA